MSRPLSLIGTLAAALLAVFISAAPAQAQPNYFWRGTPTGSGGDGTWNLTNTNWSTTADFSSGSTTWNNSGIGIANFGGTAGTVTLENFAGDRNVAGLVFTTSGYVFTGDAILFADGTSTINTNANDATINSQLAGTINAALNKTGTGTLTLGSNNFFDGALTISAGVVAISTNGGLGGTFGNTTVASGAALQVSGAINSGEVLVLNGTGIGGAGALRKTGGTETSRMSGNITLNSATRINSDAGTLRLTGVIDGAGIALTIGGAGDVLIDNATNRINTGNGSITKDGAGTLTIATDNAWTGALNINAGVVSTDASGRLGTAGLVTINGGTLRGTGDGSTSLISSTRGIALGASGGTIEITNGAAEVAYNGVLSGAGSLTKIGPGALALGGNSTNSGPILIGQGTLRIRANNERIGNSSAVTVASGAAFDLAGFTETIGSIAGAGNITLGTNGRLVAGGDGTSTAFSGVISGGGTTGGITKAGAGTLTLSGANTHTGTTVVNGGTLLAGAANTLSATSAVVVNTGATLNLADNSQTIPSLAGAGNVALGTGTPLGTLTVGDSTSTTFSGVISGTMNVNKVGSGTLTLSGNNTYAGTTDVNVGRLLVMGQTGTDSGTGSGTVVVGNGATLGGNGRIAGGVIVTTGGTIRGGDASMVGTLTINGGLSLPLATSATVGLRVNDSAPVADPTKSGLSTDGPTTNPTSNNFIHVTSGGLSANPATILFTIDGTNTPVEYGQTYSYRIGTVLTSPGVPQDLSGVLITNQAQFSAIGFEQHGQMEFSVTGNVAGELFVNITPVPEPATVLGLAAGALGLGGLIRRRVVRRA